MEAVELLLERRAKLSATDNKGDSALHIAMRARSKAIVELLLRNPKHSQLLYKPNKQVCSRTNFFAGVGCYGGGYHQLLSKRQ